MAVLNPLGYSLIDWTAGSAVRVVFELVATSFIVMASYVVIWFYWRGRNWARWFVLITSLIALSNLMYWSSYGLLPRLMIGLEAVLAVFLLYWLNTSEVKSYFKGRKVAAQL